MTNKYQCSEALLQRAIECIPLGSQTFSKSYTQLPKGVSPFFATHGKGAVFWDVDGNEILDFTSALASISLGYADSDVNLAVANQLEKGTIFSVASELEIQVAEKLCELIPTAEKVRFGKNGSDATAGAVRAARAITGRDHVITCGYHGWQDWYIGSTSRNKGVPKRVQELTHSFTYNDIHSLEKIFAGFQDDIACVILEPVNVENPSDGFLQSVIDISHENGALTIFDETVTGFRYANGGAQSYFGVNPDISTFGKGMANGFPLSAVVAKSEIMKEFEEIFYSFTFGGETLSLAACLATMDKIVSQNVVKENTQKGTMLWDRLTALIDKYDLSQWFAVGGNPQWSFFLIKERDLKLQYKIRTLYIQEMFKRNVFCIGSHNLTYAHSADDIEKLLEAYNEFFKIIELGRKDKSYDALIEGSLLEPLFKVR